MYIIILFLSMFSSFVGLSVLFATIISFLPPAIMLWYRKALSQRSFGWPFFGYSATILGMGLFGYLFSFLYQSAFPSYHIFMWPLAFFIFLLFKNEYYSSQYKKTRLFISWDLTVIRGIRIYLERRFFNP